MARWTRELMTDLFRDVSLVDVLVEHRGKGGHLFSLLP